MEGDTDTRRFAPRAFTFGNPRSPSAESVFNFSGIPNDGREVAPTIRIGIVKDDHSAVIQTTYTLTYKVADVFQMDGDVAGNDDIGGSSQECMQAEEG